jgi:hypothetical protein
MRNALNKPWGILSGGLSKNATMHRGWQVTELHSLRGAYCVMNWVYGVYGLGLLWLCGSREQVHGSLGEWGCWLGPSGGPRSWRGCLSMTTTEGLEINNNEKKWKGKIQKQNIEEATAHYQNHEDYIYTHLCAERTTLFSHRCTPSDFKLISFDFFILIWSLILL